MLGTAEEFRDYSAPSGKGFAASPNVCATDEKGVVFTWPSVAPSLLFVSGTKRSFISLVRAQ
jgi:hypothetical protein